MEDKVLCYPFILRALMDGNYICERQKVLKSGLTDYVVLAPDEVSIFGHITAQQFDELLKNEIIFWFKKVDNYEKIEIHRFYKHKEAQQCSTQEN